MTRTVAGSRCAIYVGGVEYKSIFCASLETGISACWLTKSIKKNNGEPLMIKNQMVVTRSWVRERVNCKENKRYE